MVWTRHIRSFPLASLGLTIAYTASGKIALLLAVPPGYASPIFPPAGIAVAAMLISGRASLPWTFLGSLLLNIWNGYSAGNGPEGVQLAAGSVIAAASTLQAAVGGTVLRHAIGYPAPGEPELRSPRQRSRCDAVFSAVSDFLPDELGLVVGRPLGARGSSALRFIDELGFVVARRYPWGPDCAAADPRNRWRAARVVAPPRVDVSFANAAIFHPIRCDIPSRQ